MKACNLWSKAASSVKYSSSVSLGNPADVGPTWLRTVWHSLCKLPMSRSTAFVCFQEHVTSKIKVLLGNRPEGPDGTNKTSAKALGKWKLFTWFRQQSGVSLQALRACGTLNSSRSFCLNTTGRVSSTPVILVSSWYTAKTLAGSCNPLDHLVEENRTKCWLYIRVSSTDVLVNN